MSQSERADWADELDGASTIIDGGDPFDAEYLYWVGCAGSFDDKNKKVTQAMAKLMQRAGIDFAILGPAENCTGDSGPPLGQRVHLPDAGHAEHRDAQRHGREEDHHPVPALLQHPAKRVPAARRPLRGRAPQPVPRVARRRGPARPDRGPTRRARRLPRQLLPRSPQRHLHGAPQGHRQARRHRDRRGRAATAPRACAVAPVAPACGWRRTSARRSTTSAPRSWSTPAPAASPPPARSAT